MSERPPRVVCACDAQSTWRDLATLPTPAPDSLCQVLISDGRRVDTIDYVDGLGWCYPLATIGWQPVPAARKS